eukprot:841551-Alexandrium_andersonii.AAC.1
MSASLVGSEMCIRDRRKGALESTRQHRRAQESAGERKRAQKSAGDRRSCLLYTSDAADDM